MDKKKWQMSTNVILILIIIVLMGLVFSSACAYFAVARPLKHSAKETGTIVGEQLGNMVGTAIGSRDGILKGIPSGLEDGREQGLKAEEITISIHEKVKSVGKLEVLQASVSLVNEHSNGSKYKKLEIVYADAVYSVNLEEAEVAESGSELRITLPAPELALMIDDTKTTKIAEYEKFFFDGSARDGFIGAMNSMKEVAENAEKYMSNYDALMTQARNAAKNNVAFLVGQMTVHDKTVIVEFADESGAE